MRSIAIIPARSGSKGVKDKNIRPLAGKPLLAYSIAAAQEAGVFDEIMVSTDSQRYADIALQWGANVPFLRSEEASSDRASSTQAIQEVVDGYHKLGKDFDCFCLLQPTSPLRTAEDVRVAYALFCEKASYAVVSVCEAEHSPLWCGHLPENGEFIDFLDRNAPQQRQEGKKFYRLNGAIYIAYIDRFRKGESFYQAGSFAYIMAQERSIDIDSEWDFMLAEYLMKMKNT